MTLLPYAYTLCLIFLSNWQLLLMPGIASEDLTLRSEKEARAFKSSLEDLTPTPRREEGGYFPFEIIGTEALGKRGVSFNDIRFVAEGEIVKVDPRLPQQFKGYFFYPLGPSNAVIVANKKNNSFFVAHQHAENGVIYALTREAIAFLELVTLADLEVTVYSSLLPYDSFKDYRDEFGRINQPEHIWNTLQCLMRVIKEATGFEITAEYEPNFKAYGGDPYGCAYEGREATSISPEETLTAFVNRGLLVLNPTDVFHFDPILKSLIDLPVVSPLKQTLSSLVLGAINEKMIERWDSFMPSIEEERYGESDFYNGDRLPISLQKMVEFVESRLKGAIGTAETTASSAKKVKIGPNSLCPCGSSKKYKKCCGAPVRKKMMFK